MHGCRRPVASLLLGVVFLIGPPAPQHGPRTFDDWQRELKNPAADVRARAVQALAAFDRRAVPPLAATLGDKEYRVRASAAEVLVRMPPDHVVPGMIEALGSAEAGVRANAAVVLGAFGPAARAAVPALARALRDPNLRVRELAGEALTRTTFTAPGQPATLPLNCH
jgi:HEAT repeat protein